MARRNQKVDQDGGSLNLLSDIKGGGPFYLNYSDGHIQLTKDGTCLVASFPCGEDSHATSRVEKFFEALGIEFAPVLYVRDVLIQSDVSALSSVILESTNRRLFQPSQFQNWLLIPQNINKGLSKATKYVVDCGKFEVFIDDWSSFTRLTHDCFTSISSDGLDYSIAKWHPAQMEPENRFTKHTESLEALKVPAKDSERTVDVSTASSEAILGARSTYLMAVQEALDKSVGIKGKKLVSFISEVGAVLASSGLVVSFRRGKDNIFGKLEVCDGQPVLRNFLQGEAVIDLSRLPEMVVHSVERLGQEITNTASHANIQLLPNSQVPGMSVDEFFLYFDRVRPHVPREKLKDQFQNWLDGFSEEKRSFNNDFDLKRHFARGVNLRAKSIGCRFLCGKQGCGKASGLLVTKYAGAETGTFVFSHEIESGSTSHSKSKTLPLLRLISE